MGVDTMEFPTSFDEFAKDYGFKDDVYTNGSDLIQVSRVKQWLEHDNKLHKAEVDTAYECGKYADKWISIEEEGYPRIEDEFKHFLVTDDKGNVSVQEFYISLDEEPQPYFSGMVNVVAWQPLPAPYKRNGNKAQQYKEVAMELLKGWIEGQGSVIHEYSGNYKKSAMYLRELALKYLERLDEEEGVFNELAKDSWISMYYETESSEENA